MEIPSSGRHLSHMDTERTLLTTDIHTSFVGSVRYFGGIVLSVRSTVDISIVVEWSADGVVFIPDLNRIIDYDAISGDGFYERSVMGEFVRFVGTNVDAGDGDIHIQVYAKIRDPGNYDNGVDIDDPLLPPTPTDVWWYRDPADPSQTTQLKPPNPGPPGVPPSGNLAYAALNEINKPDPALDYRSGTTFLGEFSTLDWQNRTLNYDAYRQRNKSFIGTLGSGNLNVTLKGPGIVGCNILGNQYLTLVNTQNNPQGNAFQNTLVTATSNNNKEIWNMRNSLISSCYDSEIYCRADGTHVVGPGEGYYGCNTIHGAFRSIITDNATAPVNGCFMRRNFLGRFYACNIVKRQFSNNFFHATRVDSSVILPSNNFSGCAVITDSSNQNKTDVSKYLQLNGAVDVSNKWHSRFANGYDFWTDSDSTIGIRLLPNSSTFAPICDERFKQDLVEYTDTQGVLDRMMGCKVQTFHHKSLMNEDPVLESAQFRITATAQDLNYVFHPEEGDAATLNAFREAAYTAKYIAGRREGERLQLVEFGILGEEDPLTPEQDQAITDKINLELADPDFQQGIIKKSMMTLNTQEYMSALHLCIKELKSQLDLVTARLDVLEGGGGA